MTEHPKSTIYRLMAQNPDMNLEILDTCFSQTYIKEGNMNLFKCTVKYTLDGEIIEVTGDTRTTKKDSEYATFSIVHQHVDRYLDTVTKEIVPTTRIALSTVQPTLTRSTHMNTEKTSVFNIHDIKSDVLVVVDFENISRMDELSRLEKFASTVPNSITIIKVAGFCSSMKDKADIVVRSNRKDSVDHYISYLVGLIESKDESPKIYVISRDKFGSCLQDFCKNVKHCSDVIDFIQAYQM